MFKNMYTLRSPPPLIVTDNYCLPPLARVTQARASLSFKFMCLRSVGVPRLPQLRLKLVDTAWSWKVCACRCVLGLQEWCEVGCEVLSEGW